MISFVMLLACNIFLSQRATASDELSLVTRYAGMGYNILEANPEGDFSYGGADPGIKTTRFIFKLTNEKKKEAFYKGETMEVPDQVTFHMSESCAKSRTSNAYSGQTSYKHKLSVNVDASGTYDSVIMFDQI